MRAGLVALGLASLALSPVVAKAPLVLTSADCAEEPLDSLGADFQLVCGFWAVEINDAGDRLLTITRTGRVQLWNDRGKAIAEVAADGSPDQSLAFVGDKALVLDAAGILTIFDAAAGAVIAKFEGLPPRGVIVAPIAGERIAIDAPARSGSDRERIAVSLVDGGIVARHDVGGFERDRSGRWAAGVTTYKAPDGRWRGRLHLADPATAPIAIDRWCVPIGPKPQCVSGEVDSSSLYVFDYDEKHWTVVGSGIAPASFSSTTIAGWSQIAGRAVATVCELQTVADYGGANYLCRIVDAARDHILHRFASAGTLTAVSGLAPDGEPELRVAIRANEYEGPATVLGIDLDGELRIAATRNRKNIALRGPAGWLWLIEEGKKPTLFAPGRDGRAIAELDAAFTQCVRHDACREAKAGRRLAGLFDGKIAWGSVEDAAPAK